MADMIFQELRGPFGVSFLESEVDLLELTDHLRERNAFA